MLHVLFCWALSILVVIVFRGDASAYDFRCEPCGYGGGGRFTALTVAPHDPQVVLVGSDVGGVFKSTDGGDNFAVKGKGLEGFSVAAISFHPDRPSVAYLLTDSGLYHSSDNAESWSLISASVRYAKRFFGSNLLIFFDNALWAGTDAGGVFRIAIGTHRPAVTAIPGLVGVKVNSLAVHRGMIHAATSKGVYRLEEKRWHAIGKGLPAGAVNMTDMAAHPGGWLYAVEKNTGLYLRDDKAEVWVPTGHEYAAGVIRGPRAFKALALDPDDPKRVFLAAHPEEWPFLLLESRTGGRSWEKVGAFVVNSGSPIGWRDSPEAIEVIYIYPRNPERMFLADWWNVWRSTDRGQHWRQLTQGLQNVVVNDIKQHPREPGTLFMGVADNGLVKSVDGGRTWTRIMRGVENGNGIEIELSRSDWRTMYFLLQPWVKKDRVLVYKSTDGGNTWQDIGFSIAGLPLAKLPFVDGMATNIELDPHREGVVYVGTNGYGIFKTVNDGRDWAAVNNGLATPFIKGPNALLAHPLQPDTFFAGTQSGGIYITTDAGSSWRRVSPGNDFIFGMAADPFNPQRFIAGCAEKKLLVSADGGMTWKDRKLPGDTPPHIAAYAVAYDPVVPNKIYAGTLAYDFRAADGLYVSTNGGETFTGIALELPRVNINILAIMRSEQSKLLLGFNGVGLYCTELNQ